MKPVIVSVVLFVAPAAAATLDVTLSGTRAGAPVHVSVVADEAGWAHEAPAVARREVVAEDGSTRVRFDALPAGRYAVEAWHDVNRNGRLDFNFLHIPKEPVGSSRNPEVWRRPRFEECVFDLPAAGTGIRIDLK